MAPEKLMENNPKKPPKKRNPDDLGRWFQEYIGGSKSPEEALFKINELLNAGKIENTRKNVRAPLSVPVTFKIGGKSHSASSYTLSQKGAFIKFPNPPKNGTVIEILLKLPDDGGDIRVEGEVVNSITMEDASKKGELSGMAVVFRKIGQEQRRRIDRLVRSHARRMRKAGK